MMVRFGVLLLGWLAAISVAVAQPADHLASWNDGATKKAITDFVARVTTQGGADYVPPPQRIAEREYAYDRQSKIGKLDKALDEGAAKGWTVVDMKRDWKTVFPSER